MTILLCVNVVVVVRLMDANDIEFMPSLNSQYVLCLNNTYCRIDRVIGFCDLHDCSITFKQEKKRKCIKKNCKYLKKEKLELNKE